MYFIEDFKRNSIAKIGDAIIRKIYYALHATIYFIHAFIRWQPFLNRLDEHTTIQYSKNYYNLSEEQNVLLKPLVLKIYFKTIEIMNEIKHG